MIALNSAKRRVEIVEYDRAEFLASRWSYRAGQHVTCVGPTDWGKTTFMYQLLEVTATPKLPAISLVMKPKDETVDLWTKGLGHRVVRAWPPPPSEQLRRKPPGYALWPKHTFDADADDARLYWAFKACLSDSYKRGNRIVFSDEVAGLARLWNLDRTLDNMWERGRSMKCGLWGASQRPYNVPQNAYGNASHLFVGNDPDERSRKRYGEIGGVDAKLVENASLLLPKHSWLYLRRDDRSLCIVGV